jgi:peptide/nickel transport system substrate-binding protein
MKTSYIVAIVAVIVIVGAVGGYMYWQNMQAEARKAEKRARWETWSKTLYVGMVAADYHPGISIGRGDHNYVEGYLRGGKLLWVDAEDINKFWPSLAESYEYKINPAGEAYIEYKIKEGLKFPDGTDVDAEAIKWTWEYEAFTLPEREANRETYHIYCHTTGWKRLEAPDKYTFLQFLPEDNQNFLPHPWAFLHALAHSHIMSPDNAEQYAKETSPIEDFAKQVGYGPFLLDSFVVDQQSTLLPWDDYISVAPAGPTSGPTKVTQLDKVVLIEYADSASLRMALETGEIDIATRSLAPADYEDLTAKEGIITDRAPAIGFGMLFHMNFRPEFAPLTDLNVRKAVFYTIDVDEICEKTGFGLYSPAHSPVREFQPYYKPVFMDIRSLPYEERLEIAKELLAEAGYPDGFSSEIWISDSAIYRDWATIIQAQLKKVGIETEIRSFESGVYYDEVRAGHAPMFFRGWTLDYNDPDSELWYLLHSSSDKQAQRMGYSDPHMDDLLERGKALYDPTGDPPERKAIYEEIQQMMVDDAISVMLLYQDYYMGWRDWVKDFTMWKTTHTTHMGLWSARKVIPDDWETTEPPR